MTTTNQLEQQKADYKEMLWAICHAFIIEELNFMDWPDKDDPLDRFKQRIQESRTFYR